jgi:hypothetical protein
MYQTASSTATTMASKTIITMGDFSGFGGRSDIPRTLLLPGSVVARKSHDHANAFPQFCSASVCGTRCFSDGCLIVLALNN